MAGGAAAATHAEIHEVKLTLFLLVLFAPLYAPDRGGPWTCAPALDD